MQIPSLQTAQGHQQNGLTQLNLSYFLFADSQPDRMENPGRAHQQILRMHERRHLLYF